MTNPEEHGCGCDAAQADVHSMSRRSFLTGAAAVGAGAAVASQGLATKYAFAADQYDGDVVVVLSLRGGFDGLNAFVPTAEPRYRALRPTVAIPESKLIPLNSNFGMHPALEPLARHWRNGSFGIVHAVGMANPTRSHFAAMGELERAAPGTSIRSGWLDRMLGLRSAGSAYRGVQLGANRPPVSFGGPTAELSFLSVDSFTLSKAPTAKDRKKWRTALMGMNSDAPPLMAAPARMATRAVNTAANLQQDNYRTKAGAAYPRTELGDAMKDVAHLVKAKVGLQVACVDFGDWDMHSGMGSVGSGWLRGHLSQLAKTLDAFATDLGPAMNRVTVITLSEFGRRVKENGSGGTDHGHGQAIMMLGGGVRGGRIHGQWPGLAEENLVDGDLAGTTDYRNVLAELLEKRCGAGALDTVFPGLTPERLGVFRSRS